MLPLYLLYHFVQNKLSKQLYSIKLENSVSKEPKLHRSSMAKRNQLFNFKLQQSQIVQRTHLVSVQCTCCVHIVLQLLLRCNMGKVRDRFGGMGRFKGWVNSVVTIYVITDVITSNYL